MKTDIAVVAGFSSDVSHSISKDFLKRLAVRFTISPSSSQMSVIQIGSNANIAIKLNSVTNLADFSAAVNELKFAGNAKSMDQALRTAFEQSFEARNGMRIDAEQVLVLVTDLRSDNPTAIKAALALYKEAGIRVIVISTDGQVIPENLIDNNVEMVVLKSFDELKSEEFLDRTTNSICHLAGIDSVFKLILSWIIKLKQYFPFKRLVCVFNSKISKSINLINGTVDVLHYSLILFRLFYHSLCRVVIHLYIVTFLFPFIHVFSSTSVTLMETFWHSEMAILNLKIFSNEYSSEIIYFFCMCS